MKRRYLIFFMMLVLIPSFLFASGKAESEPQAVTSASLPYKTVDIAGVVIDWERKGYEILFTITAPTTGWVALGIDPTQKMRDAQFMIGYVTDSGEVVIRDDFGVSPFAHKSDLSMGGDDDIRVIEGYEKDGSVTLSFAFPASSSDLYDVILTAEEVHTFLVAYGADGADDFTSRHRKIGKVDVQF